MGVKGLWQLLAPVGKPVSLESLEGKVLSVGILFNGLFQWFVSMRCLSKLIRLWSIFLCLKVMLTTYINYKKVWT